MADESSSTAGKRFSEDLRHIREERDISVSEIHHETQIAETLIESFEAGRLYDHPTYNRVYLRSFVKAYADAVRISRERALEALDAALEGTYEDALASTYLTDRSETDGSSEDASTGPSNGGDPSPESRDPANTPEAPTAGGPEGRGGIVGPPRAVGEDPPAKAEPDLPDSPVQESPPPAPAARVDSSSEDTSSGDSPSPPDETADDPEAASTTSESSDPVPDESDAPDAPDPSSDPKEPDGSDDSAATDNDPAWMQEGAEDSPSDGVRPSSSPAGGEEESALGTGQSGIVGEPTELGSGPSGDALSAAQAGGAPSRSGPEASRSDSRWTSLLNGLPQHYVAGAGIVVVLLVLVGLGIAYFSSDETEQSPPTATGPPDTTMAAGPAATETAAPQRPPADVRLGSTIHLTVLARDTVSALRIERDEDLRRPYWIVEGEAEVFPFQERVSIENELSNVRLFVEGYPYPVQPQDTSEGLELTRSGLQSFVDTLRGAPASLSVSPDTIPVGPPTQ
jgi:hypothetical protein